jgi:FixJ family two-component response regulator
LITEQQSATPATLLIVDDDTATREGLARMLADDGYRVLTADSFERALAVLKNKSPDLLLLDVRLGEFNGLQLLVTAQHPVPAIVMTGYADAVLERDARQLGAEYLVKPITHDLLLSMIERRLPATASSRERRWQRKQLPPGVATVADRFPAQMLDVSYGGVRLKIDDASDDLPPNLALALPGSEQFVHFEVIWSVRQQERTWQCGAAIVESDELLKQGWRELVDSV